MVMIHIQRPSAPPFLIAVTGPWHLETERAKVHYGSGAVTSFEFEHYNHRQLKDELKKIFVKCAYCESSYGAVFDGDVEHFRPKGKINEKNPQTPGYYWLANDWDNLFLACQHCNQRRKHLLFGDTVLTSGGKLDQFPIEPEEHRLLTPTGDFAKEERARRLLNPCVDDPALHLAYEPEEGVIVPLTATGDKSVKVFMLDRTLLVQERKKRLYELFLQIKRVKRELERMNQGNADPAAKAEFESELAELIRFTTDQAPYAGMCRFFVKTFLVENGLI